MKSLVEMLNESANSTYGRRIVDKIVERMSKMPNSNEFTKICMQIANLKDANAASYFIQSIVSKFPSMKEEFGEIEGHDKYAEGIAILDDAYPEFATNIDINGEEVSGGDMVCYSEGTEVRIGKVCGFKSLGEEYYITVVGRENIKKDLLSGTFLKVGEKGKLFNRI